MLKSPYPYFGGKSRVADLVWKRLGDVKNYVEPFFGSGAMLLARPNFGNLETVIDIDGYVSNFWRALQSDPDAVANYADWPVNEADLHARHYWLLSKKHDMTDRLMGDPDWYDAKMAGWWVWGISCWIGSGWCSGNGPWHSVDGVFMKTGPCGVSRKRPNLGNSGQGVNRKLPHLGDNGRGVNRQHGGLLKYMQALADRMRNVRVCCGDWARVCGFTPTSKLGLTGVFLDPPYSVRDRSECYTEESFTVANDVRAWAIERGNDPKMRIALCGYDGEHDMPDGWVEVAWKAHGGYGNQGNGQGRDNSARERIWFSPHCLRDGASSQVLFDN